MILIDLTKCEYAFLVMLLSHRKSLSTENKTAVIAELAVRNRSGGSASEVEVPH